jgi:tRNA (cmo5U34)-methyltransferase
MDDSADANAAIWQSEGVVRAWAADAAARERSRAAHLRLMALLLPFGAQEPFTFLDLGAGTGAASRAILERHPRSTGLLADFSAAMMSAGEEAMRPFAGRYRYVEFDLSAGAWPAAIPAAVDAVVTSMCVHHLPDERKQSLFAEIRGRLVPGGWYLNYDPVRAPDAVVAAAWERVHDLEDPAAAARRLHRTAQEQARYDNHVRYLIPLSPQLGYLRDAGFQGVDVYWKSLENVIYGGRRPR